MTSDDTAPEPSEPGPVERATLRDLEALGAASTALGEGALAMARGLDSGRALMAAPAMLKQLAATLKELTPRDGGDDFTRLMESLSAEVRNASPTGTPDPGR